MKAQAIAAGAIAVLALLIFTAIYLASGDDYSILSVGLVAGLFTGYFVPSIVAVSRRHNNEVAIMALNLLAGWTFLGWIIALVWSLTECRQNR